MVDGFSVSRLSILWWNGVASMPKGVFGGGSNVLYELSLFGERRWNVS